MNTKKKILILGGGFGGIYSALSIFKHAGDAVEITIINRTNYFLFTPMLHEVATGGLGHHQVVESIREIIYKTPIRFFEATVFSVNLEKKEVVTDQGSVPYDILILALGSSTNFFNTPGAEKHSLVLKNLRDAIGIRDRIMDQFEKASRETDMEKRKKMLTFVIAGGGATGVEFAAELAELSKHTICKYYRREFPNECARIIIVGNGKTLLPQFSPKTQERAMKSLLKKKVTILMNLKVIDVSEEEVVLESGEHISTETVIWTAGVRANAIHTTPGELPKDPAGRIITLPDLSVPGFPTVFAIGDGAHVPDDAGNPYPMLAQVAVEEAKHLGKNISRLVSEKPLLPFSFSLRGALVSLGQWEAAGTIGSINMYGKFAWFLWRTVYLFKFISRSKRIKIAFDWTVHIFFPRDITRS